MMSLLRLHGERKRLPWRDERAAQLVEFAVALPLLVVFVVGIFDFSNAFTLKQKLTNLARDAARAAAAGPTSDVPQPSAAVPASVSDVFQMIDNYLVANKINDCGITAGSFTFVSPTTWKYSSNGNGCPGNGLVITINRAYFFPQNSAAPAASVSCSPQPVGSQTAVISTCVSIQYAYQWKFGRVESLLGSTAGLPASISAVSVAMNEN
jgi:Flp pilus assembly protein TadG